MSEQHPLGTIHGRYIWTVMISKTLRYRYAKNYEKFYEMAATDLASHWRSAQ